MWKRVTDLVVHQTLVPEIVGERVGEERPPRCREVIWSDCVLHRCQTLLIDLVDQHVPKTNLLEEEGECVVVVRLQADLVQME